jgi:hypothetical protein
MLKGVPTMLAKAWELYVPGGGRYADLVSLCLEPLKAAPCTACGKAPWQEARHLEVVWEPGCDVIGDFTNAVGPIVVKETIADTLLERFAGFEKGRVVMAPDPKGNRPKRITKRTKPRVWLPYDGPPLAWLRISKEVPLLPRSSVTTAFHCSTCGKTIFGEFAGIELKNSSHHAPRQAGKGLFFRKRDLGGADFFRPTHTGFKLCTDRAKDFILSKGWNNIEFLEVGDILADK